MVKAAPPPPQGPQPRPGPRPGPGPRQGVTERRARAPGRVNLIGEHTDYTGGLALPMAIDMGTEVTFRPDGSRRLELRSDAEPGAAIVDVGAGAEPGAAIVAVGARPVATSAAAGHPIPGWARYVAAVAAAVGLGRAWPAPEANGMGGTGEVRTALPLGAGLSSSAALEVALALALGDDRRGTALALACRSAEEAACGVPCGVMDQLASVEGVAGHALLVDCATLAITPVPLPEGVEVVVVHSGQSRRLAGSAYALRRSECEMAQALIGPLRRARPHDAAAIADPVLRRRARHVITENARVLALVEALASSDLSVAGAIMAESHASLAGDFEASAPVVDELVARLGARPGVHGARLTGGGWGGCVVALAEPGAIVPGPPGATGLPGPAWVVRAGPGATVAVS